jgi:hypothetical protein
VRATTGLRAPHEPQGDHVESYMMFGVGLMIALIAFAGVLAILRAVH